VIARDGDRIKVSGRLTMETVAGLFNAGLQPAAHGRLIVVDLARVEAVDSAAVSLLLSWLRRAERDKTSLAFAHVPDSLLSLARLYGVAELLPLTD
jgi:phospholipid transport system transporter-binding protein